jgi:hypothetical protein
MDDKQTPLNDDLMRQIEAFAEARFREMQERGQWSVFEMCARASQVERVRKTVGGLWARDERRRRGLRLV